MVDNSTERMENISESITLPVQETGSQGRSQLCLNAKCYTTLPDGIVTGVTVQLPQSLPSRQHDKKVKFTQFHFNSHYIANYMDYGNYNMYYENY